MYVSMYVYTYVCLYVCMYVCVYVCMHVYTYVCIYAHTHSSILSGTSTRVMPEIDVLRALPGLHPKQHPPHQKKKSLRALADL